LASTILGEIGTDAFWNTAIYQQDAQSKSARLLTSQNDGNSLAMIEKNKQNKQTNSLKQENFLVCDWQSLPPSKTPGTGSVKNRVWERPR